MFKKIKTKALEKSNAHLGEPDLGSVVSEATAAKHHVILADQAVVVATTAAARG